MIHKHLIQWLSDLSNRMLGPRSSTEFTLLTAQASDEIELGFVPILLAEEDAKRANIPR